ncbi:MAG: hypothetical protein OSB03_06540 [Vicinamibacterales bacterium]|nr:hypothetical protein [Vicinamibacterales bacterium]
MRTLSLSRDVAGLTNGCVPTLLTIVFDGGHLMKTTVSAMAPTP